MFSNTQMTGTDFAFPDICKTLIALAVVPIPYPNMGLKSTSIPNIFNLFTSCMPDHNLLTITPMSTGDQPGLLLGVISNMIMGPVQHMLGSFKVFKSVMPATKMLSPTWHNNYNMVGVTLVPCQFKVLIFT